MRTLPMVLACAAAAFAQSADTHTAGDDVTAPVVLSRIEPEYTSEARSKGLEGVTTLYAEITKSGTAANIRVVKPFDPGLDAKAVDALKQWRFRPGKRNGKPVTVAATIEIRFQLPRYPMLPSSAPRPEVPRPNNDLANLLQLFIGPVE